MNPHPTAKELFEILIFDEFYGFSCNSNTKFSKIGYWTNTVDLKEIVAARNKQKRTLQKLIGPDKTVISEIFVPPVY